ncbi:tetratricopeptide repeat protein [Rhodoglobus vestalii]|uniref:Tetratricopeptide repeat protein n=1 Tax=Rhodoglobus vestalii TaxID=193384 RepID=A0A8H2K9Y1_9MICO|nr:tetratricopeptide repeat protein [Rhodoglobus vestalii]TQO20366.1 tetratricopeptide repeat protein [Rhodoglobus vestalii]
MGTALEAELDRIVAARDRDHMAPTIAVLEALYGQYPHNPRVLYEVGGAYDTDGQEATAVGFYERAMAEGLEGDVLRRCSLQYGSTLRNLGRTDESILVFARARAQFPESVALGVFESLTLHAAGRANTALGSLLALLVENVHSEEIDRYKPAIRGNAEYLVSLDSAKSTEAH